MDDPLDYQQLIQESFRDVVRRALAIVAEQGLPEDHHFYIAFASDAPGVGLPPSLRQRFPEQMTIVLQYQFWDLRVRPRDFSVKLSFSGVQHEITVPFAAIVSFSDPPFTLQFPSPESTEETKTKTKMGPRRTEAAKPLPAPTPPPVESAPAAGKVVSLDEFRKK